MCTDEGCCDLFYGNVSLSPHNFLYLRHLAKITEEKISNKEFFKRKWILTPYLS